MHCIELLRFVELSEIMRFSFRPFGKGPAQVLGELESEVIRIIWDNPASSAGDVQERLSVERQLAYTTVVTVLDRLFKKGLLTRRKEGKAFLYSPRLTREEFNEIITRDVLAGLLKEGSRPTLTTFVDLVATDEQLLEELEELVRRKKS